MFLNCWWWYKASKLHLISDFILSSIPVMSAKKNSVAVKKKAKNPTPFLNNAFGNRTTYEEWSKDLPHDWCQLQTIDYKEQTIGANCSTASALMLLKSFTTWFTWVTAITWLPWRSVTTNGWHFLQIKWNGHEKQEFNITKWFRTKIQIYIYHNSI